MKPGSNGVSSIAFNADGTLLASGQKDGTIHLWDVGQQSDKTTLRGDPSEGAVDYVSFASGSTLVSLTEIDTMGLGKTIRVWDISTGGNTVFGLKNLTGLSLAGAAVAISPDGKLIAKDTCGSDIVINNHGATCVQASILFLDSQSEEVQATLSPSITGGVLALVFSPDNHLLAVTSGDGTVELLSAKNADLQQTLPKLAAAPTSAAFSADSSQLAVGVSDGSMQLWNVKTGVAIGTLTGGSSAVLTVAFNADGSVLASAGADKMVTLWDVKNRKQIAALKGHTDKVTSIAFNHDSTLLASGSLDGTITLWGKAK